MTANDMTFGVELETTVPAGTLRVGPHGSGADIPNLPGWKADADPSIRPTIAGHVACEFVSPVFKGADGLAQCLRDLAAIKRMGARVNESCGLHVHVGIDKSDVAFTTRLVTLVSNFEKAIYAITGTKKREQGRWCNGLQRYGAADRAIQNGQWSRYHVANLATGEKPTVEFRAFGGTLDATKLSGYVSACLAIVERAATAKKATDWAAKTPCATSPIHRGGEGQTAVTRLFYQLGWTKGRQKHVHGDLRGDGIPTLTRIKKEFMRLARKYDAPPAATPRFGVGTRVRLDREGALRHGQDGVVILRQPRRQPVVRFEDGRQFRVQLRYLRAV